MEPWQDRARCKDLTIEQSDRLFFLGPGGSPKRAQKFCAQCPVQKECREESILYGERGIWAGLTDEQRASLEPFLRPTLEQTAIEEGRLKRFSLPSSTSTPIEVEELPDPYNWLKDDGLDMCG